MLATAATWSAASAATLAHDAAVKSCAPKQRKAWVIGLHKKRKAAHTN